MYAVIAVQLTFTLHPLEYVDFHENKYKTVKKSVYQRKYHLENLINDICSKYKLQISVRDLTKIYEILEEID